MATGLFRLAWGRERRRPSPAGSQLGGYVAHIATPGPQTRLPPVNTTRANGGTRGLRMGGHHLPNRRLHSPAANEPTYRVSGSFD